MSINFKYPISANSIEEVVDKITKQLQPSGFGVLTNINFADKLKEKIGVDIPETIVLGICNPKLAYQVYLEEPDFLSLIPCNVVIRHLAKNDYIIEMVNLSEIVKPLANTKISNMAFEVSQSLNKLMSLIT